MSTRGGRGSRKHRARAVKSTREHINVVFIGHVDAGKSTLAGQLMYLSGLVDERSMEKMRASAEEHGRDSWSYAFVMDVSEEERERGKTVEVARAEFRTETKDYTILDAPGHRAYVPSMIGGCSQADVAILVISARKGEFETGFRRGGQTREHTTIAKTLGITRLVVVVNKMDVTEGAPWSQERFTEIETELRPFLFRELGFKKRGVTFLPVSGIGGENLIDKVPESVCPWYEGLSLVQTLDSLKAFSRKRNRPLRFPIIDRYRHQGSVAILGKIEAGRMEVGQTLVLMPGRLPCEVLSIVKQASPVETAAAGDNVEIFVKGISASVVHCGMVLCDETAPLEPIQEFLGNFLVLDKPLFAAGYAATIHIHTAVCRATVTALIQRFDKTTGQPEPQRPRFGRAGDVLVAKFRLERPVCIEKFEVTRALGRFTLREESTVAVGKVLKIRPLTS